MFAAFGIATGDRAIMPAYARRELAHSIAAAGLIVELADVDETLTLDAADLDRRIAPQTRVVVVHHAAGAPADVSRLFARAGRQGAIVVEDVSEASGATLHGSDVGTFGDVAIRTREDGAEISARAPEVSGLLAAFGERPGEAPSTADGRAEAASRRARRDQVLAGLRGDLERVMSWRPSWDPGGDSGTHLVALFNDAPTGRLAAERLAAEGVTASPVFAPEHGQDHVAYFWGSSERTPWPARNGGAMDPGDYAHSWAVLSRAVRIDVAADLRSCSPDMLAGRISIALGGLA